MAISQTMSNPNDWIFQPNYNANFSTFPHSEFPPPTNAFTSAAAAATSTARPTALTPEQGRVAKPVRKRSRASRRTPTTLLNTDTANFRAMVQHFTGGPTAPFAARPQIPSNGIVNGPGGLHVEYPGQLLLHQQQHGFMMGDMHGGGETVPGSGNRGYGNYMAG